MSEMTKDEIVKGLRQIGWEQLGGRWYAPVKKGYLKAWQHAGMTLREAASVEGMSSEESLSEPARYSGGSMPNLGPCLLGPIIDAVSLASGRKMR